MTHWKTQVGKTAAIALLFVGVPTLGYFATAPKPLGASTTLNDISGDLARDYPKIAHWSGEEVTQKQLTSDGRLVLIDVREPEEFAVSHLPGALRVSPDADPQDVLRVLSKENGNDITNLTVVFYCSVGLRGSRLAEASRALLTKNGVSKIANLSGGIFAWHGENRPLESGDKPSNLVHPFDKQWARLVKRQGYIAYKPDVT